MILQDFLRALSQMGDARFARVVGLGILLALALLVAGYGGLLWLIDWADPGSVDIPLVGPVKGLGSLLGFGSFLFMFVLSVVLMVPIAAAFSGLFLEDVADAVEDRFHPGLPPVTPRGLLDNLIDIANFFGLYLALNLAALLTIGLGPVYFLVYWAVNGWLLGREYFTLVAARRLPKDHLRRLRAENRGGVLLAGMLMALPLSIPLVSLVIPVLGVATFTHFFHRVAGPALRPGPGQTGIPRI